MLLQYYFLFPFLHKGNGFSTRTPLIIFHWLNIVIWHIRLLHIRYITTLMSYLNYVQIRHLICLKYLQAHMTQSLYLLSPPVIFIFSEAYSGGTGIFSI